MENKQEPQVSQNPAPLYAVYGTLRQGFGNNRRLQNEFSEFLGAQTLSAPFRMVSMGGFPGMISTPGKESTITIEVFRVTSSAVERSLDALEGYPGWYDKKTIETQWGTAYIYTQTEEQVGHLTPVPSGDWKQFVEERYPKF
jgi:gamma-glutamylcyclotransferase (GGCT)/AIG2-like uncharacterized protein YtfP